MDSMAVQQQTKQKRELESRFVDFVAKKRRITTLPETKSVVYAASTRVANPFSFNTKLTSSNHFFVMLHRLVFEITPN